MLAVIWGLVVAGVVVYLFFPYQKAVAVALQNTLNPSGKTPFSVENILVRHSGMEASRLVVGQQGTGGPPVLEMSGVRITWHPLSALKGTVSARLEASLYEGRLTCTIRGILLPGGERPGVFINFRDVKVERYPEGRLPWVKGLKGTATGWVRSQPVTGAPGGQRTTFSVTVTDGEIRELRTGVWPRLVLPFDELSQRS